MIKKLALITAAFFMCSGSMCAHRQEGPRGVVLAPLDRELAAQCIGRVRRGDVPQVPEGSQRPRDRDTARYIRTLEDAYEICERVVREGVEAGNVQ